MQGTGVSSPLLCCRALHTLVEVPEGLFHLNCEYLNNCKVTAWPVPPPSMERKHFYTPLSPNGFRETWGNTTIQWAGSASSTRRTGFERAPVSRRWSSCPSFVSPDGSSRPLSINHIQHTKFPRLTAEMLIVS